MKYLECTIFFLFICFRPSTSVQQNDPDFVDENYSFDVLNQSLELLGESLIKRKRVYRGKVGKVQKSIAAAFMKEGAVTEQEVQNKSDECEIIKQLKEKFSKTEKRSERMMVLSCLPKSWSRSRIQEEFRVTQYMARAVKKMVKEKGVLVTPKK